MALKKLFASFEKFTFQLLVFLLPTQASFHLWPDWAHVFGIRVDYLAPTIYLTDLLLVLLLLLWLTKIVFSQNIPKGLLIKARKYVWKNTKTLLILAVVVTLATTNIIYALRPEVAILKWIKIAELGMLSLYIVKRKDLDISSWIYKPLKYSIILFFLIAVGQFVLQRTINGPFFLLGERSFKAATPGIALVSILGKSLMRAYSTFPHPNSFAGYFLVAGVFIYFFRKKTNKKLFSRNVALLAVFLGLIISFSLGVWITAGVLVAIIVLPKNATLTKLIFCTGVISSLLLPPLSKQLLNKDPDYSEGVLRRLELSSASGQVFSKRPVVGVGLNNFIIHLPKTDITSKTSWWLQPVHNIFLLLLVEVGLLGLLLFVYLINKALDYSLDAGNCLAGRDPALRGKLAIMILAIIFTGLVDHYWLTLQQNQMLMSLVLGLSFRRKSIQENYDSPC